MRQNCSETIGKYEVMFRQQIDGKYLVVDLSERDEKYALVQMT